jgi:type IV pilus assembly protein PilP
MAGVLDMIRKTGKHILIAIFVAAISCLFSCGEKTPPVPQAQVVKKKIGVQQDKAKPSVPQAKPKTTDDASAEEKAAATPDQKEKPSKLVEESMAVSGVYNAKGRFDPFEPLFKSEGKQVTASRGKKTRRIPQTPLERVAISQLKLSAIMRSARGNSAIVEDATGKGYVIRKGTYIGLNSGQVTQIDKSSVMIEEEVEDVSGEYRIQNIKLKLQKPAGEL